MYNEQRKIDYLKSLEGERTDDYLQTVISVFNKTEPYEEMYEKDLCDFSHEEISSMYSTFGYANVTIYNTFNYNAKKYVEWCDKHLLIKDYVNHFCEFGVADFEKYVDVRLEAKRYLTYEEFEELVRGIVNARDQFLFRCLYEFGKSKNYVEIMNMKIGDIDERNCVIKLCTGRVVSVSRKLVEVAREADEELTYYLRLSLMERTLQPSEYIFKTLGGTREGINNSAIKYISRIIKLNLDDLGGYDKISTATIAVSGQFNMIRRRSSELGISKKDYVFGHFDELRRQYLMTPNTPKMFYQKYEAYL